MISYASPFVAVIMFLLSYVGFVPGKVLTPETSPSLDITGRLVDRSRQLLRKQGWMNDVLQGIFGRTKRIPSKKIDISHPGEKENHLQIWICL